MSNPLGRRPIVLLGHPVSHSLSPIIHNRAFELTGQPYVYYAADVRPAQLAAGIEGMRALGYRGANVTIPYKCDVISHLDELTPQAQATAAVNTIVCERAGDVVKLVGDNTDIAGFLLPLMSFRDSLFNEPALVIGAGGAARAVVYSLLRSVGSSSITIAVRDPRRADALVESVGSEGVSSVEVISLENLMSAVRRSRLIVNATPVGMHPHDDETPVPDSVVFGSDQVVYDLIYKPRPTQLLRDAAARGAVVIDGLEMLLGQAAAAFVRWTGVEMPLGDIRREVESLIN